ncbi:hypothetical protein B0H34DRAFT_808579 [Crassisporium funariophilum]|nr:hypothetical protein B0H34DRAFT_808579 [Crassisporium funariophilum]
MHQPHLPPELIGLVFDIAAARKDWDSLRAYSLLSSDYIYSARRHLFATVTLKLRSQPNPIHIRDVARRLQGLCDLLRKDSHNSRFIQTLEVLDSYPFYESQWITQQRSLPAFLDLLEYVQTCTFGCEVGFLDWSTFGVGLEVSLKKLFTSPRLKTLSLCNIGSVPASVFNPAVQYLHLNNVTVDALTEVQEVPFSTTQPTVVHRLCYLNVRTVSAKNTHSVRHIMEAYPEQIRLIKWRCWEDAPSLFGASLSGRVDIGKLPRLTKLCFRLSYGNIGRDLLGLIDLLDTPSNPLTELRILKIDILFPNQSAPHRMVEVRDHTFWSWLATVLQKREYLALRQVILDLTIHGKPRTREGRRENSVAEFRAQIRHSLDRLFRISTFHTTFKVHGFRQDRP